MSIGALLQLAKQDAAKFVSQDFQVDVVITTPDGTVSLPVTGLGTGTWLMLDVTEQGKSVNSRSNHINIPEVQLIAGNYPYKKGNGRIDVKGHKITLNDGGSMAGTYVINEQHPNATLGLIICTLGALKE